jgi:RNA-binding protein
MTTKQRQFLKGLAHNLSPVVRLGKAGLSEAVIEETKVALRAHELIKVKIEGEDGEERRAMAGDLAAATEADLVGTVGKVSILYRAREENPGITLP